MLRATIRDVARQAKVSVATVNRVLHEPGKVREETTRAVLQAAELVGFYGVRSIQESLRLGDLKLHIGVLLLQRNRALYKMLAQALEGAAAAFQAMMF